MIRNCVFTSAAALAVASSAMGSGKLIAVDSGRILYEIDRNTGAKTQIGTVSTNAGTTGGLAYNTATQTLYVTSTSNDALYTLDLTTGTATIVGAGYGTTTVVMHGLEWDSSTGTMYGGSNGNLFSIDINTGIATQIGSTGLTSFLNLGYNPVNNTLYATNSGTDSFYSVDRTTGAATLIGPLTGLANPNGLAWVPDDNKLYLVDNNTDSLYTVDLGTGAPTLIGSNGTGNLLGLVWIPDNAPPTCYPNCDGSTIPPILNVNDFTCFINTYAAGSSAANCDASTVAPVLNVNDFTCFINAYAAGCR